MAGKVVIEVQDIYKKFLINQVRTNSLKSSINEGIKQVLRFNILSRKKFQGIWALKGISFKIKQAEVVGIIGRNGAGKSTLLKILSKITPPTKGRVILEGRTASLLEAGTGFHPELSGRDNVFLNGSILGMSRREVKTQFDEIVLFSGVEPFIDTPVKHYSSGMKVRLAFAVAAHLRCDIMLIDEVLAVGDAAFQQKCLQKMETNKREGRTIIFVSHQLATVKALCEKCILLDDGCIQSQGPTERVIGDYLAGINLPADIIEPNRKKDEAIYFSSIKLSEGRDHFSFNEDISLECDIGVNKDLEGIQMCLVLLDKYKERVFSTIKNLDKDLTKSGRELTVRLIIPKKIIAPNEYSFLLQLYLPPGYIMFDQLSGVCPIKIEDSGTELMLYENYGKVIIPCKWKISQTPKSKK